MCHRDFETGIVVVFPHGPNLLVATELEVLLLEHACGVLLTLLTHDEVLVDVKLADSVVVVRDLQGRTRSVAVPNL